MAFSPTLHTGSNKPLGFGNGGVMDARSYFFENNAYRPYKDTNEVLNYLLPVKYRTGNFSIFIQAAAGQPLYEYWFRDGTGDAQLVLKQGGAASEIAPGTVQLATDAEMKLTAAVTEDSKVSSRLKIFNWWVWVRSVAWTITARWSFGILQLKQASNATPQTGDVWFDSKEIRAQKTVTEALITSLNNDSLKGTGERIMSAGPTGGPQATHTLVEQIVTDIDIVNACKAGIYNSTNGYTSGITPADPSKFIYKGQLCRSNVAPWYLYFAIDDNRVSRIPLG